MKSKIFTFAATLVIIITAALLMSCSDVTPRDIYNYEVKVVLRECEGLKINSESAVTITAGRDVQFEVEISDDYMYLGNNAQAYYDEGKGIIRLNRVVYPTTIDLILVKKSELLHLNVHKNSSSAFVTITDGEEWMINPGEVTVKAEGYGGNVFEGWSINGFLSEGGSLISTDPEYTFYMENSIDLYANFVNLSEYTIIYHANGGTVRSDGSDKYIYTSKFKTMFPCQQTLESNDTFVRDGYVAVGYSTEPVSYEDYSNVNEIPGFSNMGGVCEVGDDGRLDLYVVWAKASPESDFTFSNGTITGYKGSDKIVVIPEKINGRSVTRIGTNVFTNSLTRVVIPKTVLTIDSQAFNRCNYLSEVVFFDSVTSVTNASFTICPKLSTIVLNASRLPKYSGTSEGSFCIKYELVRTLRNSKKIVVVSGSSTLNGLDSDVMEENFPGYSVVNYGTNAANQSVFFLDVISNYVTEGDLIIHAPEFTAGGPMGNNAIAPKMFRGNEQCYDIFREVDMTKYTNFFDSYNKFINGDPNDSSLTPAKNLTGKPYQLESTGMNKYGDLMNVRDKPRQDSFGAANVTFNYNILGYGNLNRVNKQITAKGGVLLMSFGTFDKSRMNPSSTTQAEYDRFTQDCASKLDYPVISNVGTYIMEHKYFYDSEWHCTDEGAAIRTANLTIDIRKYLKSVGK